MLYIPGSLSKWFAAVIREIEDAIEDEWRARRRMAQEWFRDEERRVEDEYDERRKALIRSYECETH